ncbi:MAG: MATE family efflux transporter [Bacillota bacterium]|nr:MATE family efflux transporter [Bacillota bacterium]
MSTLAERFRVNMTAGPEGRVLLRFALPMIVGNLLQQSCGFLDAWIVGRHLGPDALAVSGSAAGLMLFINSILIGFGMGAQVQFSLLHGSREPDLEHRSHSLATLFFTILTLLLFAALRLGRSGLTALLRVDPLIRSDVHRYLDIISLGLPATAAVNLFGSLLRARGDALRPVLVFSAAAGLNIVLALLLVIGLGGGVTGAAWATVGAQGFAAIAMTLLVRDELPRLSLRHLRGSASLARQLGRLAVLTSLQQSIMNFGGLMIQSLVNSFGYAATAGMTAGLRIDGLVHTPLGDYANAFSVFVSVNYGAGHRERLMRGYRVALAMTAAFALPVSLLVVVMAPRLIGLIVGPDATATLAVGVSYLRIEGAAFVGIAWLLLHYALFRGLGDAGKSVLLTVISLGTRVLLAYALASRGLHWIWIAIPTGWLLADLTGVCLWRRRLWMNGRRNHHDSG